MAEKKGVGHANTSFDFLNVVFRASSLFLFLSVVWMVWDDFDREWEEHAAAVRGPSLSMMYTLRSFARPDGVRQPPDSPALGRACASAAAG